MNRILYYDLVMWLSWREVQEDIEEWTKNILLTVGEQYELQGSILYRKINEQLVLVIQEGKTFDILKLVYDHPLSGHIGPRNTLFRL